MYLKSIFPVKIILSILCCTNGDNILFDLIQRNTSCESVHKICSVMFTCKLSSTNLRLLAPIKTVSSSSLGSVMLLFGATLALLNIRLVVTEVPWTHPRYILVT